MDMQVEIRNVGFAYKKEPVLKDVSLQIKRGDFVALVGPNGSGKSTLIRCIDGLLVPQRGMVLIDGTDVRKMERNQVARMIAYVPQSEGEKMASLVYDIVLLGRKPYIGWRPGKKDHTVVVKVLKMLNLEPVAMSKVNELSGGQKQRVFIARALAQEPDILLLDEPTANLDLKHSLEVLQILQGLTKKNITVIIAIHDLNLAARFCDHIVMLDQGEVFAEGGKNILTTENINKLYGINVKLIRNEEHILFVPE